MSKTKPKPARARPEIVLATDVRFDRGEVVLDQRALTDDKGRVVGQAKGDRRSYLTRHVRRGEITMRQCLAGERYAADYEHATAGVPSALDPARMEAHGGSVGSRGLPPLSADPIAWYEVRRATDAIGAALSEVVVWVAVRGLAATDWAERNGRPARDGMAILRFALDALAGHYRRRGDKDQA